MASIHKGGWMEQRQGNLPGAGRKREGRNGWMDGWLGGREGGREVGKEGK